MIFDLLEIMQINFNGVALAFRCHRVAFEWERYDIESFQNDKRTYVCVYILDMVRLEVLVAKQSHSQSKSSNLTVLHQEEGDCVF